MNIYFIKNPNPILIIGKINVILDQHFWLYFLNKSNSGMTMAQVTFSIGARIIIIK